MQEYVKLVWLEITCGEAPYICSRYDTTTGKKDHLSKESVFWIVSYKLLTNVDSESDWLKWTKIAYKACFGYEWQGDNVLKPAYNILRLL